MQPLVVGHILSDARAGDHAAIPDKDHLLQAEAFT
jgi:hypothetical protein